MDIQATNPDNGGISFTVKPERKGEMFYVDGVVGSLPKFGKKSHDLTSEYVYDKKTLKKEAVNTQDWIAVASIVHSYSNFHVMTFNMITWNETTPWHINDGPVAPVSIIKYPYAPVYDKTGHDYDGQGFYVCGTVKPQTGTVDFKQAGKV